MLRSYGAYFGAVLAGWMFLAAASYSGPVWAQAKDDPKAKEGGNSSPEALIQYKDAADLQNSGEFALAEKEWRKFGEKFAADPLAGKARYYLGVCLMQQKKYDDAAKEFQATIEKFPKVETLEDAQFNLAWCQYTLAQGGKAELYAAAEKSFAALLKTAPTGRNADHALFLQADCLYYQNKKAEAAAAYQQLLDKFAQSKFRADALYAMGVAHEELQHATEAGAAYEQFLKDFSTNPLAGEVRMRKAETVLQAGLAQVKAGKSDDGKKLLADAETKFGEAAASKDFKHADHALFRQALAALEQGKLAPAAELYAKVNTTYPQSAHAAEAAVAAGHAYLRAEKFAEAATWLEKGAAAGGETAVEAAHWLAQVHLKQKQPDKAAAAAAKAIPTAEKSPFLSYLKMDQADALYETPDKRAEALKLYEALYAADPKHELAPQALYNAAFAAKELKQFDAAMAHVGKFEAEFKNHALLSDVRFVAAECQLLQGKTAESEKVYRDLLAANPNHPDAEQWHVQLARTLHVQKKYKEAGEALTKAVGAIKSPERQAEAQYLLGLSQFYQDQSGEAVKSLEKSLATAPKWRQADEAALFLARALRKQNKLDEAIAILKKLLTDAPETKLADQIHYRLGDYAAAKDDAKTAQAEFEMVLNQWPNSPLAPYAIYGLGTAQLKAAQNAEAAATFSKLIEKYAQHELVGDARFYRAAARRQAKQFAEAITDLDEYLKGKLDPNQKSSALYEKGLAEAASGNHAAAASTFDSILKENEKYAAADKVRYELAWAFKAQDKKPEALAQFEKLAAAHADSPLAGEANIHVGDDKYEKKDYDAAAKAYAAAAGKTARKDLKELATYKLGWCYYNAKKFEEAQKQFAAHAAEMADGKLAGDGLFMKAECLFELKKHQEALAAFRAAQAAKPSSPNAEVLILLHGGQSAGQLKQWDESLKLLAEIPTRFPDSPYLSEALCEQGLAQQNLKQMDEAVKSYEAAASKSRGESGAKARFMLGEIYFERKQFDEALAEFKRVVVLYGGENALPEVKKWQAKSAYEAGRCAEVQVSSAKDGDAKTMYLAEARKHYTYVAEKHPQDPLAGEAKKRIDALSKL